MGGESKLGNLQRVILEELASGGALALAFLASNASVRSLIRNYHGEAESRIRQRIFQSVFSLKRRRLVDMKEQNGKLQIVLSEKGKKRVLQLAFEDLALPKKASWDHKWRIIMFDIPERYGKARRALSQKIRGMGALTLQKSVYIYPFSCRDEIDFVSEFFHVSPYVRYVEATSVEGESELEKHFGL